MPVSQAIPTQKYPRKGFTKCQRYFSRYQTSRCLGRISFLDLLIKTGKKVTQVESAFYRFLHVQRHLNMLHKSIVSVWRGELNERWSNYVTFELKDFHYENCWNFIQLIDMDRQTFNLYPKTNENRVQPATVSVEPKKEHERPKWYVRW